MGHAGVAAFYFGAYGSLILVLLLHIDQAQVELRAVGYVDGQVHRDGGTLGEIESD